MSEQLKAQRLERRKKRLEQARVEMKEAGAGETGKIDERIEEVEERREVVASNGTFGVGSIERWARGK